jgi:hypothetical protein
VKDKVHPRSVCDAPEKQSCSFTLSQTSALDEGASSNSKILLFFSRQIETLPIEQLAGWAQGSVCKGKKVLAPTSFRPPDLPPRSDNQTYIKVII